MPAYCLAPQRNEIDCPWCHRRRLEVVASMLIRGKNPVLVKCDGRSCGGLSMVRIDWEDEGTFLRAVTRILAEDDSRPTRLAKALRRLGFNAEELEGYAAMWSAMGRPWTVDRPDHHTIATAITPIAPRRRLNPTAVAQLRQPLKKAA